MVRIGVDGNVVTQTNRRGGTGAKHSESSMVRMGGTPLCMERKNCEKVLSFFFLTFGRILVSKTVLLHANYGAKEVFFTGRVE